MEALTHFEVELNFALDLLSLADQYLLEDLKRKCEEAIQKSIRIEDSCLMLNIAVSRGANTLKKKCLALILANFSKVIV